MLFALRSLSRAALRPCVKLSLSYFTPIPSWVVCLMAVQTRFATLPSLTPASSRDLRFQSLQSAAKVSDKIVNKLLELPHPAESFAKQNISRLSVLLKDANVLPERFVIPENHRPRLPHDGFSPEVELPMINFENLTSMSPDELKSLAEEVGAACRDWGFFQIVNHGVPEELIKEMESNANRFFDLPYQQKEKAAIFPRPLGYNGRYKDVSSSAPWIEAMAMQQTPVSTVETTVEKVWPEGNPEFRKAIWRYHAEMEKLGQNVVELLAISLGLEKNTFSQHFQKSWTTVRWNHYPPCPIPSQALGLLAHSDPCAVTMLHQDNVGGLQIRKDGRWIAVKPRPDTFVINLGDVFQAWTNGRYKSVEHRAVVNQKVSRLSMVLFYGPQEDVVIAPPAELVDEEHPLQYRPFTWSEYNAARLSIPAQGKRHLDVFAGTT